MMQIASCTKRSPRSPIVSVTIGTGTSNVQRCVCLCVYAVRAGRVFCVVCVLCVLFVVFRGYVYASKHIYISSFLPVVLHTRGVLESLRTQHIGGAATHNRPRGIEHRPSGSRGAPPEKAAHTQHIVVTDAVFHTARFWWNAFASENACEPNHTWSTPAERARTFHADTGALKPTHTYGRTRVRACGA